jgi:hypothetical protein
MRKLFGILSLMLVPVVGYAAENGLECPGTLADRNSPVQTCLPFGHPLQASEPQLCRKPDSPQRAGEWLWRTAECRPDRLRNPVGSPAAHRHFFPSTTGGFQHKPFPSSRPDPAHTSWLLSTAS